MEIILAGIVESAALAAITMLVLGGLFALVLLVASIKLKVEVDPKVEQVHAALPNIDCGACGYAGCGSYAKAVVANPELIGACAPGGADVCDKIAAVLNLQMSGRGAPLPPMIHCRGTKDDKMFHAIYDGIQSCTTANAQPNVQACNFGCLGYGDCVRACKFDALHVINGLATVVYEKCTGCGACANACPRNLIEMVPFKYDYMMTVACRSIEKGPVAKKFCGVGCIGCGICKKQSDLFTVDNFLARIDYKKYEPSEQTDAAMEKCPTKVIIYRGKNAPAPQQPKD